jgi:glutathione synthase/RimK-type ligase-like ATP-grasp enzyme
VFTGAINYKNIEAFLVLLEDYLKGLESFAKGGSHMSTSDEKNKLKKYLYLKDSAQLEPYLPETQLMEQGSFWIFMDKYGSAIVKPIDGSRGCNVIQVIALGNNEYEIHLENRKIKLQGIEHTYGYIRKLIGSGIYIVQQLISRATINELPFDMRVIVQRRRYSSNWEVTGKVAKVAGRGYIVSNITRSKGTVLPVKTALWLSPSLKGMSQQTLQAKLDSVALLTARQLSGLFPNHRIYGLDMGLDRHGHVWIIEVNLSPSRSHFLKLKDKTMYRRITAYKKG